MSDIAKLTTEMSELRKLVTVLATGLKDAGKQVSVLASGLKDAGKLISDLAEANLSLKAELVHVKTIVNRQASYMATLDAEFDDLAQYGRRENIVFTNLLVDTNHSVPTQVVQLCSEIGVDVSVEDLVDAHPLPSGSDKPKRFIARFKNRSKAKEVFANRKQSKNITGEKKTQLASDKDRGFGILPNLTPKRGKFFAQVKSYCTSYGHEDCWVDSNTGKILLKLRGAARGTVVKSTGDLVQIDQSYSPDEWYFCAPPYFGNHSDNMTPPAKSVNNTSIFSPSMPSCGLTDTPTRDVLFDHRNTGVQRGNFRAGNQRSRGGSYGGNYGGGYGGSYGGSYGGNYSNAARYGRPY